MNQIADIKPDASSRRSPYFSEEHEMLRAQVRRFVETEIKPHALAWEEQGFVPREVLRRMGELGLFRHPLSGRLRRLGDGYARRRSCWRRSSAARPSRGVAITALVHTDMASVHVFHCRQRGAEGQAGCRGIIAGDAITAVAVTEPDAGSDVKGIRTFARRDGDGYVLNGAKMFITNGVHADLYCVAAKTGTEARRRSQVDHDVSGREGHAWIPRQPRARQAWLALVRHRRTAFRGLPHSGRERARPRKAAASTRSWATSRTSAP